MIGRLPVPTPDAGAFGTRTRTAGWLVIALGALVAVATVAVGRSSVPVFLTLLGLAAILTGLAARRWPLATLVIASLMTLADPLIAPALVPAGFDPSPVGLSEPMLLAAGAVILVTAMRRGTLSRALRDPVPVLTALFVGASIVSAVVNAVPPVVALLGIAVTVDVVALYVAVRMVPVDTARAAASVGALVALVALASLVGIAQVVLDPGLFGITPFIGQFGEGVRIGSFLGNPNMLAAIIGLALPFALYGSRHLERFRWFARMALFVLVLALLLTFSRGGWLAIGLGATVGALIFDWRAIPLLVMTVALAWVTMTVMPTGLLPGAAGHQRPPDVVDTTLDRFAHLGDAADLRARFIRDGLPIVRDHSVIGVGPGRYGGAVAAIVPSPVYEAYDTGLFGYRTVHNFWLHLLGETGVVGMALFLTMIVGLIIRFARAARTASGATFVVLAGAATMLMVASLNSATEMIFEGNTPAVLLWLVAGLASCLAPTSVLRRACAVP